MPRGLRVGRRRLAARARRYRPRRKFAARRRIGNYRMSKIYRFKRINQPLIIQNGSTAGSVSTNDGNQLILGASSPDTIGWKFGAAMQFRLANVQSPGDYTQLYDQYRIVGVKITIIPTSDSATTNSSGYLPTMYWAQDSDDGVVPTESVIRQKQNTKFTRLTGPRSIYVKYPKLQTDVLQGGTTMVPTGISNTWLNCDNDLVIHNALKMYFYNVDLRAQPNTTTAYRIDCTYYLQFRNPQ